jgi:hypothetical protein
VEAKGSNSGRTDCSSLTKKSIHTLKMQSNAMQSAKEPKTITPHLRVMSDITNPSNKPIIPTE